MTRRRLRRLGFVVVIAVGAGLIAVMLAASELSASSAADEGIAITAPHLSERAVHQIRADLTQAEAFAAAMRTVGLSRLASLSGETPAAFLHQLAYRNPQLAAGISRLPSIQRLAEKVVTNLERRRGQFESAASLPGLGITKHDAAWVQLALGALLILVGALGVVRPRRATGAIVLAIAAALIIAPLALDYPAKTADTDALLNSLRPFTIQKVHARQAGLRTARTVFVDFRDDLIPQVATRAHTTTAVVNQLASASPELSGPGFAQTDAVLDRFGGLVAFSGRIQPLLARGDTISARTDMWILIGAGIALLLASSLSLITPGPTSKPRRAALPSQPVSTRA